MAHTTQGARRAAEGDGRADQIHSADAHAGHTLLQSAGLLVVLILAAAIFFLHLGAYGLWDPDESRYAEIAREMITLRSFIVPHLNYVPYVEKPPLLYWLTAVSFASFGLNEFAARLPCALAAIAGVLSTYLFALRTFDRSRAILAGAILATTPLYAVMAQVLTTDMLLTACLTVSWFAFFLHWREGGRWCWIAYVALALGALAKGPVAIVLTGLIALAFLWWEGELRGAIRRFAVLPGAALVMLIASPWFIVLAIRQPDFVSFYFVGEHLRRFLQPGYSHGQPLYYYVPVLLLGAAPYSVVAATIPWRLSPSNPARRFCLIAAAVTFTFFSSASGKLIPYILPIFPPLAVILADALMTLAPIDAANAVPMRARWIALAGLAVMVAGAGAIAVAIAAKDFRSPYPLAIHNALLASGIVAVAGGAIASAAWWMRRPTAGIAAVILTTAAMLACGTWGRIEAEPLRSYAQLGRDIANRAPDARLICYGHYIQALPFYCRRRVILVGAKTELAYGADHSPDAQRYFFNSSGDLIRLWQEPGTAVIVLDADDLKQLGPNLGRFIVIGSERGKRAILGTH